MPRTGIIGETGREGAAEVVEMSSVWSNIRIFLGMVFAPERTLRKARAKKDAVIAEITRRGGTVEIAEIRKKLEASTDSCPEAEREAYMRAVDEWISSLEAKYGKSIPFDESCRIADELKNLH